jgi:hypothetical protein
MPNHNNNDSYWESPSLQRAFEFLNSGAGQKVSLAATGVFALTGIASIATGFYPGAMISGAAMIKSLWTADHGIGIKSSDPDFSGGLSFIAAIIFGAATGLGQGLNYAMIPEEAPPQLRALPELKGLSRADKEACCQGRHGWVKVPDQDKKVYCY